MSPAARHDLIRRVLSDAPLHSQDDLRRVLAEEGVDVTQGTLSRDLRMLGVVKGPGGYAIPDGSASSPPPSPSPSETALERAVRVNALSVATAGNLVVLRTRPGHAQPVGLALDADSGKSLGGVVGTIAGDDTVFIAVRTGKQGEAVATRLRSWAGLSSVKRKRAS